MNIIRFLLWTLLGLIGLALVLTFLPIIIVVLLILLIIGMFRRPVLRVWTNKVQQGAQTVRKKVNDSVHEPLYQRHKPGAQPATVVDAQVRDLDEK